jgi:predicted nucleic acid-binding protein
VAVTHLVDTSTLKRLGNQKVRAAVEQLATSGVLARPTICDLEIGYSARNASQWDRLIEALAAFEPIQTSSAHVRRALQVQRLIAQQSQRARKIPDLLVAAAAEEHDLTVVHYDNDFDLIASVTGQRCRWIVPAGSAD